MTGYHMTLGYTANTEGGEAGLEKNWRTFKRVVAKLRERPRLILDEVMRVEKKHWTATEWAEAYSVKAGQAIITSPKTGTRFGSPPPGPSRSSSDSVGRFAVS